MKRFFLSAIIALFFVGMLNAQKSVIPVDGTFSWTAQYTSKSAEDSHLFVWMCFFSEKKCRVGVFWYNEFYVFEAEEAEYYVKGDQLVIDFTDAYPRLEHIFKKHNEITIKQATSDRLVLQIGKDEITFGKGFNKRNIDFL